MKTFLTVSILWLNTSGEAFIIISKAFTSPLKSGLFDTNPNIQVLKKYKELGGKIITVGSDAHLPEHVGSNFDTAKALLLETGFTYFNIFNERKAVKISL